MKYVMVAAFAAALVFALARFVLRFRTLRRTDPGVTWLTWVSTGLWVALCLGCLGVLLVVVLRMEGVIGYDRNLVWGSLAWFAAATVLATVVLSIDTWKRTRKVNRSPLLPPTDDEPADPDD